MNLQAPPEAEVKSSAAIPTVGAKNAAATNAAVATLLDNALSELSKLYEDKGMVFYVQNGVIMAHKKMDVAVKNSGKKKHERSAKVDVKTQD